jgi:hypothetical protein
MTLDVRIGPVMRSALDVLDLAMELVDAVPDYHPHRSELVTRTRSLQETCAASLRTQ